MIKKLIEKYWYIFIIGVLIFGLFSFKTSPDLTGSVILNMHKVDSDYLIENPSINIVNVTIKSEGITKDTILLSSNQSIIINESIFDAIGEQYE